MDPQVDKNEHFRHLFLFEFNKGSKATEAAQNICAVYGEGATNERTAQRWFHDNARPHTANLTKMALQELGWEVLPHPAYSPDVAPSDYHLFRSLSNALSGVQLEDAAALENWLNGFFASKPPAFYKRGIEKLPGRWEEIVNNGGEYIID
uniref:Mos1 transposase HTH domain-containing protein n=1 Tax=Globodera rostochiensis TaxID=31243 RepID=A0A914ID48_GLORO